MNVVPAWSSAMHVLCVRLDALGDVLMTGPAIRALKHARSDRRITLLTSPAGAAVARLMPGIDMILVYQAPWMKATPRRTDGAHDRLLLARLRTHRFDAAVVFTVYSQNPLPAAQLCHLADIPRRLAYCRENPYQLLTDWAPETEPQEGLRHEVRRQLDLVARVGCHTTDERLRLELPPAAYEHAYALLGELGVDPGSRWVLVHPGASAPSRRYPPERYARVAELLADRGYRVVYTGSTGEVELVERIRAVSSVATRTLAGRADVATLAALIALAPLLIVNNTGPAHLAAALGTPVVDLYAQTNLQHTPWQVESRVLYHDVPCRNCYKSICPAGHHDCLRRVPPEAVVAAALELLERVPERRRAQSPKFVSGLRADAEPNGRRFDCHPLSPCPPPRGGRGGRFASRFMERA